jgi:hypothetical protein
MPAKASLMTNFMAARSYVMLRGSANAAPG